jgi:RsiW-degrading membrane proteinase PrsW (M82 family)
VSVDIFLKILVGLLPVLAFLGALLYMESYKLVRLHLLVRVFLSGAFTAVLAYLVNGYVIEALNMEFMDYTHFISPIIEESLKGLVVVYLYRSNRIGFLVDGAILGFAVGAGFAMAENMYYLYHAADAHIAIWVVRGVGTAVMHGGVTAIFAVIAQILTQRQSQAKLLFFVPGLLVATVLHSIFNQFPISPILSTIATLLLIPLILMLVFQKSVTVMHKWLEVDFDANEVLLEKIQTGEFTHSKAGHFLLELRERFDGLIVADMLCYIRLHTELAMRAKSMLMAREFGMDIKTDEEVDNKFKELHALEQNIGKTAFLAMKPYLHMSRKDLWQLFLLEEQR